MEISSKAVRQNSEQKPRFKARIEGLDLVLTRRVDILVMVDVLKWSEKKKELVFG